MGLPLARLQLALWGHKALTSSFPPLISPIIPLSPFHPSVFLISRLAFPLNKWRNAGAYFLNLGRGEVPGEHQCDWQGSVLEWLRRSLLASESRCWQPRRGLQYRAGKPKNKNNTGSIFWNDISFLSHFHLFFRPFVSTAYLRVCPRVSFSLCPDLTLSLAWSQISCGSVYPTASVLKSWLRALSWWRHDVSHPVSEKHPKIFQHGLSLQSKARNQWPVLHIRSNS